MMRVLKKNLKNKPAAHKCLFGKTNLEEKNFSGHNRRGATNLITFDAKDVPTEGVLESGLDQPQNFFPN